VSVEDLEKERGAVLEEYRGGRNAAGRMQDSHWALLFQGSKVLVFVLVLMEMLQSFCPSY
jgi:hypothetical protein